MKPAATAAILVVLAAQAQGQVLPAVVEQLKRDATSLVTVDKPPTSSQLAIGLGLVALAAAADSHLVDQGREHLPAWIDNFKTGGAAGSTNTVAASLIAGGLVLGDRRVTTGGLTLLEGNLLLGVVVQLSKNAFGRVRPNHPDAGRWFAGGDSFPSSHAAHAFLIASVLDATIDRPAWRWVIYPLATGVALQRIHEGVHYPTDVLAGGLLGWWIGHRLSVSHELVERPHKVVVSWAPVPGGGCIVASISF
ncbi:MAG TPA: phosphatase PAP2 family protein [Thermoanaerobaculaceae bacterium]|nr:phosphatase PAP2 family protein [Thermoanaerobaculaceae bacterium]